jgi:MerR family transcriptional regulator, thiopeptide resistance regulator
MPGLMAYTVGQVARLRTIENEMEARKMGMSLTPEEHFEIFGTDRIDEHAEEAERRWGASEAFRQSRRRVAGYGKDDWVAIKREADANLRALADALGGGEPATGAVAMDLAEDHRRHIARWFYDCGHDQHRGLAQLYLADPRFTATFEDVAPGLARYVHDAIHANADRSSAPRSTG